MSAKKPFTYRLRPWLSGVTMNYEALVANPNAVDYILQNYLFNGNGNIQWSMLCGNPDAWQELDMAKSEKSLLNKVRISGNAAAAQYLIENPDMIDWMHLCWNDRSGEILCALHQRKYPIPWQDIMHRVWMQPVMADLLAAHFDELSKHVVWRAFMVNPNPVAIQLLLEKGIVAENDWVSTMCIKKDYFVNRYQWMCFNQNPCPSVVHYLVTHSTRIVWEQFAENPSEEAYEVMRACYQNTPALWSRMALNPNPKVIDLMFEYPDRIVVETLSHSPHAKSLAYLEKHFFDQIEWHPLASNPCPYAIQLMRRNLDKVSWGQLPTNPNPEAIELMELFQDKLLSDRGQSFHFRHIWRNPNIFYPEYHYRFLEERMRALKEELIEVIMNPDRIDWLYRKQYGLTYEQIAFLFREHEF